MGLHHHGSGLGGSRATHAVRRLSAGHDLLRYHPCKESAGRAGAFRGAAAVRTTMWGPGRGDRAALGRTLPPVGAAVAVARCGATPNACIVAFGILPEAF